MYYKGIEHLLQPRETSAPLPLHLTLPHRALQAEPLQPHKIQLRDLPHVGTSNSRPRLLIAGHTLHPSYRSNALGGGRLTQIRAALIKFANWPGSVEKCRMRYMQHSNCSPPSLSLGRCSVLLKICVGVAPWMLREKQ
jgi:hypothetical protein